MRKITLNGRLVGDRSSATETDDALFDQVAEEVKAIVNSPKLKAAFALYYTGFAVNGLFNALNRRYGLRQRTPTDVLTVLVVHGGTLLPSELSRLTARSKQIISHIIDTLERDGLVKREGVGEDRRTRSVSITSKGLMVLREHFPRFRYLQENFAPSLSDDDAEKLLSSLRQIRKEAYRTIDDNLVESGEGQIDDWPGL